MTGAAGNNNPSGFLAQLPKDGLVLGERVMVESRECVLVTIASDPLIGNSDVAAFVPVDKAGDHYRVVDPEGGEDVGKAGWTQGFDGESGDRRPVPVPVDWATGKFDGVLIVLLYNESPQLGRGGDNFPLQVDQFLQMGELAKFKGDPDGLARALKKPTRMSSLPERVLVPVKDAIHELLRRPASFLRRGVLEA